MAEKGVDGNRGGENGKEGGNSKTSLRPQSGSKENAPSSPSLRSAGRLFSRTRSPSHPSAIDSESYVMVKKEHAIGGSMTDHDSQVSPDATEITVLNSRIGIIQSSYGPTSSVRSEVKEGKYNMLLVPDGDARHGEGAAEGTDKDSPVDSDTAKDKGKKKETSRFFSSPKMRGTMFPFDQISVPMSSHRQKNVELHKIFSSLDSSEKLIDDYSCALQRDILIHGRLFVTQNWLCFYANIFTWETLLTIPFTSVTAITKERTAFFIPNAIQITTTAEKYGFSSLMSRDVTYNVLFKIWQNSLLNEHLTPLELVKAARRVSGDSEDVGTEDNLWGVRSRSSSTVDTTQLPKATASLPAVLPTHVEIIPKEGNIANLSDIGPQVTTSTPVSSKAGTVDGKDTSHAEPREKLQLPPLSREEAVNEDMDTRNANGESPSNSVPHRATDRQTATTPMTPAGGEFSEMISIGGESLGSVSEFETVSFTDETGEIPCGCAEHVGRTILNDVYAADVETIFQLLFIDPDFFRDFLKARNTINIDMSEWQEQPDGSKLRDLNYTVALNYSFGPKFSPTTEHQVYSNKAQPGLKHLVHTEVMNRNIPYADTFFVSCQYCMTRVAHDKSRLRITANINFRKNCWGVVKNLIEKNAGDGVRSFYNHLDNFLKEHLASLPAHFRKHRRKRQRHTSRLRNRRMSQIQAPPTPPSPVLSPIESVPPSLPSSPLSIQRPTHPSTASLHSFQLNGATPTETESPVSLPGRPAKRGSASFPQVNMALTLLLGILILSNMALYHHLMSYQSPATSRPLSADTLTEEPEWPTTNQEWIALTRKHLEKHEAQRQQWLDTLATLVTTLEQVESSLSVAKRVLTEQIQMTDDHFPHSPSSYPHSSLSSHVLDKQPSCSQTVDEK